MGYRIDEDDQRIIMTRGDTAKILLNIRFKDSDSDYEPDPEDTIRFSVKKYLSDRNPAIVKDIPVSAMILTIDPDDTKNLSFGYYHYDIQLIKSNGDTDTIIEDRILELSPEVF